jgi:hypothetical protein
VEFREKCPGNNDCFYLVELVGGMPGIIGRMNGSGSDQDLLRIVSAGPPATIDDVINLMQSIDNLLQNDDGLKWFNLLYLFVTREVRDHPLSPAWADPAWVTRLDVIFAGMYFTAVGDYIQNPATAPSSWQALLEDRHRQGVDRIQFALAGMNAHINHDLALALLQTDSEFNLTPSTGSPEHQDFQRVNGLLENVLPQALTFLATGIVGMLAQDTGKIGRLLALWDVSIARDLAWDFADHLRSLTGLARTVALRIQDKVTGALGRSLLLPLQ